jgi:hypothetical protein
VEGRVVHTLAMVAQARLILVVIINSARRLNPTHISKLNMRVLGELAEH